MRDPKQAFFFQSKNEKTKNEFHVPKRPFIF